MRIFNVLDKIENAIYNSRKIPLSNYAIIRKDKILNLIEKTRQNLPKEFKQARFVTQENQRIMQEAERKAAQIVKSAQKKAEQIIQSAKEESQKLLDKEAVVVNAKERADEILNEAKKEAEAMLEETKAKCSSMLKSAEMQAKEIITKASKEAEITRQGADKYVLKLLNTMESEFSRIDADFTRASATISKILGVLRKIKENLGEPKNTEEIKNPPHKTDTHTQ